MDIAHLMNHHFFFTLIEFIILSYVFMAANQCFLGRDLRSGLSQAAVLL